MWVIRIRDNNTRYEQFVRENFYEGALLFFDHEEDAVRLAVLLTKITQVYFGLQCVAQRYVADPRKERLKRIEAERIDRVYEILLSAIG